MEDEFDDLLESTIKRRAFLASAVPLAATLAQPGLAQPSAPDAQIRVGLIGAGANVRTVQIPGFRRISECEILAVANRSLQSSQAVADQFGIPRAYGDWRQLLDDADVDAVLIGTWPYMHRTITLAALAAGKHVLCQARMANNAAEAHEMLSAAQQHPSLICQLVPTSTSYVVDRALKDELVAAVGEVLSVDIQRVQRGFADFDGELDWRHDREFSGYNVLNIGSTYESAMRWLGPAKRVFAMTKTHVPYRRAANGELRAAMLPDHLDVLYELVNGAQVHMRFSETSGLSNGNQTWIFGSQGTIHVDGQQRIFVGRRGDSSLTEVANPPEQQAQYRVEEEFVNAIRGTEEVTMTTFDVGVQYMEWTEAVHHSAVSGTAVHLPLRT